MAEEGAKEKRSDGMAYSEAGAQLGGAEEKGKNNRRKRCRASSPSAQMMSGMAEEKDMDHVGLGVCSAYTSVSPDKYYIHNFDIVTSRQSAMEAETSWSRETTPT